MSSPTLSDGSVASGEEEHRPPPVIVVRHGGNFAVAIQRARALRGKRHDELVEVAPGSVEVEGLAPILGRFPSTTPVRVVYLVGDLDPNAGDGEPTDGIDSARDVLLHAVALYEALRVRYPTIDARTWIVARAGHSIGQAELALFASTRPIAQHIPFVGAVLVTSASGASLDHRDGDIDLQIADLLHVITCSDLERTLTDAGNQSWAIGVGSVVHRPDRIIHAAVRSVEDRFERLLEPRPRDAGYARGRDWVRSQALGPPGVGEDRSDDEGSLLLTGSGRGSLAVDPASAIRRLDADLEGLDPGLWAGYIAAAIDVASAPRTDPDGPASAMAAALDQLRGNLEARRRELEGLLEAAARAHMLDQISLPSTDAWCEGAQAGLEEAVAALSTPSDEEPVDLADAYRRLAKAASSLPYSASTLVRALLVVVMMVVIGYTFAPVGSLVAWAFSKRLLFFGDTLEDNARMWARITAVGTGALIWLWWEMKWRRVRRLRRRYIRMAVRQIEREVEAQLVSARISLLRSLIATIGRPTGPAATLRTWLATAEHAAAAVLKQATGDQGTEDALGGGKWAATIPARNEPNRVLDELSDERRRTLSDAPVAALASAPLAATQEEIEERLRSAFRRALPNLAQDLDRHWAGAEAIGPEALAALSAPLWSGLPEDLAARRGAERHRHLIASPRVADLVASRGIEFDDRISSSDACFAANLWVTSLVLDGTEPIPDHQTQATDTDQGGEA